MPTQKSVPDQQLTGAVTEVIRKLKSQPLLFGFGVLLLLVVIAGLSNEALSALVWPALTIFVVGSAVWLIVEITRGRKSPGVAHTSGRVKVRGSAVAKGGSVTGIEGLPTSRAAPADVDVAGKNVKGKVSGVRYGSPSDKKKARPGS